MKENFVLMGKLWKFLEQPLQISTLLHKLTKSTVFQLRNIVEMVRAFGHHPYLGP